MKQIIPILIFIVLGCSPVKNISIAAVSTPLPESTLVEVMGQGQKVPDGCKYLGKISIVDKGTTIKCTYDKVLNDAQVQARGMGGNLIQITKHKEPSTWSTCHQIWCDVYKK